MLILEETYYRNYYYSALLNILSFSHPYLFRNDKKKKNEFYANRLRIYYLSLFRKIFQLREIFKDIRKTF